MMNPYDMDSIEDLEPGLEPENGDTSMRQPAFTEDTASVPTSRTSVLGPSLSFKGNLIAGEDLLIQGRVEGSIQHNAQTLTIGPEGSVKANVRARTIIVQGQVRGDLYGTEAVVVEETAEVRGNIFAPRVGLQEGAKFKGSIDMEAKSEDPPKRATKKTQARKRSKPKDELEGEQVDSLLK